MLKRERKKRVRERQNILLTVFKQQINFEYKKQKYIHQQNIVLATRKLSVCTKCRTDGHQQFGTVLSCKDGNGFKTKKIAFLS